MEEEKIYNPSSQIEKSFETPIKELDLRPIIILNKDDTVQDAVKEMVTNDSTYVLVRLNEKDELGIITERDILKKVIYNEKEPTKVLLEEIATYPLIKLDYNSTIYEAIFLMAKHSIRKLLIERNHAPIGILEERDIILHESKNAVTLTKEINKAKSLDELRYLYNHLKDFVITRILEGTDAILLSNFITEIHDRLMKKVAQITLDENHFSDMPSFSILVLGSEGRREQSLKTDQDNALVYEASNDDEKTHKIIEDFSHKYITNLLEIGFPPCPGNVMISNPFWRRTLSSWKATVESWLWNPKPENTLQIAIFFDFRTVFGNEGFELELKKKISEIIKKEKAFVRFLANDAINFKPPLGFFKDFILEKSGEIDIKKGGILPIVQGIRALSLEEGIYEPNTFDRIEILCEKNVLPKNYLKDLKEAYRFLLALRFKFQAKKILENKEPDNMIDPKDLLKTEKNTLKDVFKLIKEFQDFLTSKYSIIY